MKKLVLALCLLVGGAGLVNAQQYPTKGNQGVEQDEREKINSRDLPDAVKRSLEGTEYRGWLINSTYKMKGSVAGEVNQDSTLSDSTLVSKPETADLVSEVYVVELKNGAQTKSVKFDKDGNVISDPQRDDNDQD